jgi:hypothetical protein
MKPRGRKLREITDFWADVPKNMITCKCGAKAVVHGYCQKHWESEGKAKYMHQFEKEAKAMREKRNAEDIYYKKMSGCA